MHQPTLVIIDEDGHELEFHLPKTVGIKISVSSLVEEDGHVDFIRKFFHEAREELQDYIHKHNFRLMSPLFYNETIQPRRQQEYITHTRLWCYVEPNGSRKTRQDSGSGSTYKARA